LHRGLRQFRAGDLLSRFVADVDSLQQVYLRAVAPPLVALGTIALAAGVASTFLPVAGLVLLAGLLLASTAVPAVGWLAARSARRPRSAAQAEPTAELLELFEGAPELVVYGRGETHRERVLAADRRLIRLAKRDALVAA
jgi:ABC-type transport system involved in cytochrome bd biosynthesis fused ATPase/permease subunit